METLSRADDPSRSYIILQNNQMHAEAGRARARQERVARERDATQRDLEASERSRVCIRGMLHNEIELCRLLQELACQRGRDFRRLARAVNRTAAETAVAALALAASFALEDAVAASWGTGLMVARCALLAGTGVSVCGMALAARASGTEALEDDIARARRGTEHLHEIADEM